MVPPQAVRSLTPTESTSPFVPRYNIQTGATFDISCFGTAGIPGYTLELYKDGLVIGDGDLSSTTLTPADPATLQKTVTLSFADFQPEHNGVYYCSATVTGSEPFVPQESDLFLYGTCKLCMTVNSISPLGVSIEVKVSLSLLSLLKLVAVHAIPGRLYCIFSTPLSGPKQQLLVSSRVTPLGLCSCLEERT